MRLASKPNYTAISCSLLVIVLWYPAGYEATDPVYTPQNLSDTSGNFAFSNATVIWADLPAGEVYSGTSVRRISEGLKAYYNMVHGFISVVLPKPIPDDLVEKLLDGNTGEIVSNYSNYTSFFIGYAICVVLGILFMLIVPIITCCFCCCRCCCKKCGGKMVQPEEDAKAFRKKWTYIIILLIVIAFMISGTVCIFMNNNATSTAINDIPKNTVDNLKNLKVYVNNTVLEATHLIENNYNFLNASLNRELDNIGYLVGLPLRVDIENNTGIRTTLTNAYSLVASLDGADTALSDIETKETALRTSVSTMQTSLDTVKTNLDTIFGDCGSCPTGRPDYATALSTGFDSNNFPDLSGPRSSMDTAKSTNMTAQLVDAESELDGIPDTVVNDSRATVEDMQQKISNLSNNIDPIMNQIKDINKLFIGSNASIDLDKLSDDMTNFGETLEQYDKYRWYGGLSLACMVFLFVAMIAGGMLLGILGTDTDTHPANRGRLANCGGILLMCVVYLIFLFSVFLMLLTTFPFLIGAPVHKLACVPITDLSELEKLAQIYSDNDVGEGKYFLGKMLMNNDTIPLTLSGMLRAGNHVVRNDRPWKKRRLSSTEGALNRDCRDGRSAYSSFKMSSKFDLNDLLNYSKTLDVQAEINSLNVDLSSVNVYPPDLQTQLSDLRTAIDINFTKFYTELSNTPTGGDLGDLADSIDAYASSLSGLPDTKAALEGEATNIRNIETNEYADVASKISALNTSVGSMESTVSGIPSQVDSLNTGLNTTNIYIQTNTGTVVRNLLNTYADRLLGIADSFTAHIEDGITNKVGNCEPVWNLYNSLLVYTFCYNLMDTFNGFWFSLGWCVFFSMLGLIFSVKLAKYFRRMQDKEYTERKSTNSSKKFKNKVHPKVTPEDKMADPLKQSYYNWEFPIKETDYTTSFYSDVNFVMPFYYHRQVENKPPKTVVMGSTKYVAKRSPLEFTPNDHGLMAVTYSDNSGKSKNTSKENDDEHVCDLSDSKIVGDSCKTSRSSHESTTSSHPANVDIKSLYAVSLKPGETNEMDNHENNTIHANNLNAIKNFDTNWNTRLDGENLVDIAVCDLSRNAETNNAENNVETNNAENIAENNKPEIIAETNNAVNIAETNNSVNIVQTNNAENNVGTNNAENNVENSNTENIAQTYTIENIENKEIPHFIYVAPIETKEMYNSESGGKAVNGKLEMNMMSNRGETQNNGGHDEGLLTVPEAGKERTINRNDIVDNVSDIESKDIDVFISEILHKIIDNDNIHNADTI